MFKGHIQVHELQIENPPNITRKQIDW